MTLPEVHHAQRTPDLVLAGVPCLMGAGRNCRSWFSSYSTIITERNYIFCDCFATNPIRPIPPRTARRAGLTHLAPTPPGTPIARQASGCLSVEAIPSMAGQLAGGCDSAPSGLLLPPDLAHRLWDQSPGAKRVLARLMQGGTVSTAELLEAAARDPRRPPNPAIVRVYICHLRRALAAIGCGRIVTLREAGYRWVPA